MSPRPSRPCPKVPCHLVALSSQQSNQFNSTFIQSSCRTSVFRNQVIYRLWRRVRAHSSTPFYSTIYTYPSHRRVSARPSSQLYFGVLYELNTKLSTFWAEKVYCSSPSRHSDFPYTPLLASTLLDRLLGSYLSVFAHFRQSAEYWVYQRVKLKR